MFQRTITPTLYKAAATFPVVFLTGPRQSGKTTLLKQTFPNHNYVSLERPDILEKIQADPIGFLQDHNTKWIIDEAQRFPPLFSYLQDQVDKNPQKGRFILSGSENFLLSHHINQTLAGRVSILELLPITYQEYSSHPDLEDQKVWSFLFHGGYPRPYQESIDHHMWIGSYIRTYIERDVRELLNVKDLSKFTTFLKLCAGHHGQLLNVSALSIDAGISQATVNEWLSILEASYILFRLPPYFKNFNKRLIKTSKLYFYDSGIVCYLLGIESPNHLALHAQRGAIFEGFAITELIKYQFAKGNPFDFYFWQDYRKFEVDLLKEKGKHQTSFEIKSSQTFHPEFIINLRKWSETTGNPIENCNLITAEDKDSMFKNIHVWSWKSLSKRAEEFL